MRTLILAGMSLLPVIGADVPRVDFNFQVRPILSDNCFRCHGHDEGSRRSGLRLDIPEAAYAQAIVPGKPAESEMIRRITSKDPNYRMPPAETHKTLSEADVATLTQWIEQGAGYKQHWAFLPPQKTAPPSTRFQAANAIDQFVFSRLEKEGLSPSPEANRETLINRLALTLTGLPPTLPEVDAFMRDKDPNAYEKVVDRLLATPAYGEHMAAYWMNIARYSESDGFLDDKQGRLFWPYRDWVISAFNKNMPFDQFSTWQLAGDLLPGHTKEQTLATAFLRVGKRTTENGAIDEEYRVEYALDRANTVGVGYLGLTTGCARCHDHKYDPIGQKDYYSLAGFFNSADEPGWFPIGRPTAGPTMLWTNDEQDKALAAAQVKITSREAAAADVRKLVGAEVAAKTPASDLARILQSSIDAATVAYYPFDSAAAIPDDQLPKPRVPGSHIALVPPSLDGFPAGPPRQRRAAAGPPGAPAGPKLPGDLIRDKLTASPSGLEDGPPAILEAPLLQPGVKGNALFFNDTNRGYLPQDIGWFDRTQEFGLDLWIRAGAVYENSNVVNHRDEDNAGGMGYKLNLENNHVGFYMIHSKPFNELHVVSKQAIALREWVHVSVTYDGSSKSDGIRIYLNGEPAAIDTEKDNLTATILPTSYSGAFDTFLGFEFGYRFREPTFHDGAIDELRIFKRALTPLEVSYLHNGAAVRETAAERIDLAVNTDPRVVEAEGLVAQAREEQNKIVSVIPELMVMADTPRPRPSYVLVRGVYTNHGEQVQPEGLSQIYPWNNSYPRNRIGLAQWLFDPGNPLTARVFVNRLWQQDFGRGIVETSEDFGTQGALPTHPELLDWMAMDFIQSGWDIKRMTKLMVMSATFRQSSDASAELLERDPKNLLLARGIRTRMSAEQVRDNALAVSGLLVPRIGGPSVYPYQPDGVWLPGTLAVPYPQADQIPPEQHHRRSLYTFIKRNIPPPSLSMFDLGERHATVARRQVSNTPLQALVLLDDPQYVEAYRVMATNALKTGGDTTAQITLIFRMGTRRWPEERELAALQNQYRKEAAIFADSKDQAENLLHVGVTPVDESADVVSLAAMTQIAAAVMNSPDAYSIH